MAESWPPPPKLTIQYTPPLPAQITNILALIFSPNQSYFANNSFTPPYKRWNGNIIGVGVFNGPLQIEIDVKLLGYPNIVWVELYVLFLAIENSKALNTYTFFFIDNLNNILPPTQPYKMPSLPAQPYWQTPHCTHHSWHQNLMS